VEELNTKLEVARERLFQMRFQSATAPLKNPRQIAATRREIARALTFLRQKAAGRSVKGKNP
jgi:large subunit ribosomal protein L29